MVNRYYWASVLLSLLSGFPMAIWSQNAAAGAALALALLAVLTIVDGAAVTITDALKK
jgi:hypothetical protein